VSIEDAIKLTVDWLLDNSWAMKRG
jgi:hypothetical protein